MQKIGRTVGVAALSLAFGALGGAGMFYVMETGLRVEIGDNNFEIESREVYVEESEMIGAIDKVQPAVVSIVATSDLDFGLTAQEVSGGSGFIVSSDGLVVTNGHVVANEELSYTVILSDDQQYPATVVSRDPFEDIAFMQIELGPGSNEAFPVVEFGDSDQLRIGQKVMAIGFALAEYDNTVTAGIISATGRQVYAYDDATASVSDLNGLLQTDAAINFGNSGGPLINLQGQVVGMNSAVAQTANGIGFAIPINNLKPVLASVQKYGEVIRPVLGVRFLMLTEQQAREIDPALTDGALLVGDGGVVNEAIIVNGAADKAGLLEGDVVLSVNDELVNEDKPLQTVVRSYEAGDKILVKFWRAGDMREVEVTLGSSKNL